MAVAQKGLLVTQVDSTGDFCTDDANNAVRVNVVTGSGLAATVAQGTAAASTAGWPITNGVVASTSAVWNNATALDSTLSLAVTGYSAVLFTSNVSGTVSTGGINFQTSDDGGVTWRSVVGCRVDATGTAPTSAPSATTSSTWVIPVTGATNFRLDLNPVITGTGSNTVRIQATVADRDGYVYVTGTPTINISQVASTSVVTGGVVGSLGIGGNQAPGVAIAANPVIIGGSDGTNAQRLILNSATNQSAATANNAALVEFGPRWRVTSTPAVSNQASASKAAGGAGVRHVCTGVIFSAGATTAPALTKLNVNLRDGATGAGTILASWTVVIPAATGQSVPPVSVMDLNLVGTAATAMTLEFSALLTNLFEDVTLIGYDVS